MSRSPDQLAREVREALHAFLNDDPPAGRGGRALAALAELQAQAEAGQREGIARLEAALVELLSVAERMRGGDPSLDSEEWYAARDFARKVVAAAGPSPADQEEA